LGLLWARPFRAKESLREKKGKTFCNCLKAEKIRERNNEKGSSVRVCDSDKGVKGRGSLDTWKEGRRGDKITQYKRRSVGKNHPGL